MPTAASCSKLTTTPDCSSMASIMARSLSCSSGSSNPIAAASRRKISWLGNACPGGSTTFTWADNERSKYDDTRSSNSRKLAAGSTRSA